MPGHINEFLVPSLQPLKLIQQQKQRDEKRWKDEIILRGNCVIQTWMLLFDTKLAQQALMDMLKDVMHSILTFRQRVRRTA